MEEQTPAATTTNTSAESKDRNPKLRAYLTAKGFLSHDADRHVAKGIPGEEQLSWFTGELCTAKSTAATNDLESTGIAVNASGSEVMCVFAAYSAPSAVTPPLTSLTSCSAAGTLTETWNSYLSSLELEDGSAWKTAKILRSEKSTHQPLHGQQGLVYSATDKAEAFADTMEEQFSPNADIYDDDHCEHCSTTLFDYNTFPPAGRSLKSSLFPKPGKSRLIPTKNFRPISLLSSISKIFERLLLSRIAPFLDGFIRPEQFGFSARDHSTTQQLCSWTSAKHLTRSGMRALLYKLAKKLTGGHPLHNNTSSGSYLTGRSFRICVDGELSSERAIEAGVPQGSVLGPVLYLVYTNDMPLVPRLGGQTAAAQTEKPWKTIQSKASAPSLANHGSSATITIRNSLQIPTLDVFARITSGKILQGSCRIGTSPTSTAIAELYAGPDGLHRRTSGHTILDDPP
ncbi:uncharacterized protein LOC124372201 [Homalodisca vitripennis]|uniref:uncharacterized protein LOC124372201 n=1 Tax=Homalodisca vitripennis TaxID=197043 RepID=UPI001EEA2C01|nr:uncharacterized protein LOC124372201 [Homalodisca vitripennis]